MKCKTCGRECYVTPGPKNEGISNCCHAEIIQEEKIQMTEREFRTMHIEIWGTRICNADLIVAKQKGYIKKSELETLVEEAEKMYNKLDLNIIRDWCFATYEFIKKSQETIQAFKTKFPEWNK